MLSACDRAGNSTAFVEFGLTAVEAALRRFLENLQAEPVTQTRRLEIAAEHFANREFTRKDYLTLFPNLSTATASRDLRKGIENGRFLNEGERALTRYRVS